MATFRKRGTRWNALVKRDGRQLSASFATKDEAKAWALRTEADTIEVKTGKRDFAGVTFRDFIDLYDQNVIPNRSDPENERIILDSIRRRHWTNLPLDQLDLETLNAYRDKRKAELAPSTLVREFKMLRAIARGGIPKFGMIPISVLEQVKLPRVEPPEILRISEDDFAAIRDTAVNFSRSQWLDPLICFALETGLRRGEILKLTWDRIDWDREFVRVPAPITKSRKPRVIPITARCMAALKQLREMFPDSTHVLPKTANAVRCAWERLRIQSGFAHIRFHDFRHEFVSRCFEKDMTIIEVQSVSGHSTISQLQVYSHAQADAVAAKMKGEQS